MQGAFVAPDTLRPGRESPSGADCFRSIPQRERCFRCAADKDRPRGFSSERFRPEGSLRRWLGAVAGRFAPSGSDASGAQAGSTEHLLCRVRRAAISAPLRCAAISASLRCAVFSPYRPIGFRSYSRLLFSLRRSDACSLRVCKPGRLPSTCVVFRFLPA